MMFIIKNDNCDGDNKYIDDLDGSDDDDNDDQIEHALLIKGLPRDRPIDKSRRAFKFNQQSQCC